MINTRIAALLGAGAMAVMAVPLVAHHSGAMFEKVKTITVEGVVKEFQYTNPHSWLLVDVTTKTARILPARVSGSVPGDRKRRRRCRLDSLCLCRKQYKRCDPYSGRLLASGIRQDVLSMASPCCQAPCGPPHH